MKHYHSLDRVTHAAIFVASLLVNICLFAAVAPAFEPDDYQTTVSSSIEEVVVQG